MMTTRGMNGRRKMVAKQAGQRKEGTTIDFACYLAGAGVRVFHLSQAAPPHPTTTARRSCCSRAWRPPLGGPLPPILGGAVHPLTCMCAGWVVHGPVLKRNNNNKNKNPLGELTSIPPPPARLRRPSPSSASCVAVVYMRTVRRHVCDVLSMHDYTRSCFS